MGGVANQPHLYVNMELSQSALRGLQVAGLSSVDDKVFSKLSLYAVQTVLGTVDPDTIASKSLNIPHISIVFIVFIR